MTPTPPASERDGAVEDVLRLRAVAEAAQDLVGRFELDEARTELLRSASKVNQTLTALGYPVDDEGLIDFPAVLRAARWVREERTESDAAPQAAPKTQEEAGG